MRCLLKMKFIIILNMNKHLDILTKLLEQYKKGREINPFISWNNKWGRDMIIKSNIYRFLR